MQPTPWTSEGSPPGWHPDPTRRFEFRYWNGERWTADVSTHGQRFVDPQPLVATPAVATYAAVAAPKGPGRGMAVAAFVVGLSSLAVAWVPFLFALGAIGAVTAFVFGVLALGRVRRGEGTGKPLAWWGIIASVAAAGLCVVGWVFTAAVIRQVNDYLDPGPYATAVVSCTATDGLVSFDGTILNKDDVVHDYTVHVRYTDGARLLDTDSVGVRNVAPLATAAFHATAFVDNSITAVQCTIDQVDGYAP